MRRWLLAMMSVMVMSASLSLPLVLAMGFDPCANESDHECPPLGDDCHDCARCSPSPAVIAASPTVALDVIPIAQARPWVTLAVSPPEAPREPPSRVPRVLPI